MVSSTLKSRIISLLIIFTILIVGLFIAIQLNHGLKVVTKHNIYKGRIASLVIEEKLGKIMGSSLLWEGKVKVLERTIDSLKESQLVEDIYTLNREGKILSSTQAALKGQEGDYNDFNIIEKLNEEKPIAGEAIIDRHSKVFSLYLILRDDIGTNLIIRLFFPLGDIWEALRQVYQPAITTGSVLILANILLGIFLSRLVVSPIKVFNQAAKTISSGGLNLRVEISTNDELQELSESFNSMAEELGKMKQRAEDANPLTRLPGNIVIRDEIERRISENKKFTVIYCDLDNFKAYNDKYGIHKGDEAIRLTGEIFQEAIKDKGTADDFLGHEGGDDFLIITKPEKAQPIADFVVEQFDRRIRDLYDKEDLEKGSIVAHARDGAVKKFPIMTISLAGVTNQYRSITSYAQVTNIAAEVKKKAKCGTESCFILDKRKGESVQ